MAPGAAWEKCPAMKLGAGEDRAQETPQPLGERGCFLFGADAILADLDEEAGKP